MIRQLGKHDISRTAKVIRKSFSPVAAKFNLTKRNCPTHTSFITARILKEHLKQGWLIFGLCEVGALVGTVSLCKADEGIYEIKQLAILPEFQRKGYGEQLINFAKEKAMELGAQKITLSIIEEHTALKRWYERHGFVHTGTKRFDHLPFTAGYMEWEVLQ